MFQCCGSLEDECFGLELITSDMYPLLCSISVDFVVKSSSLREHYICFLADLDLLSMAPGQMHSI